MKEHEQISRVPTAKRQRPISAARWDVFFDEFAKQHRGWLVQLHLVDRGALERARLGEATRGERALPAYLPLRRMHVEHLDGHANVNVVVELGDQPMTFVVDHVAAVYDMATNGDARAGARLDRSDGVSVVMRFRLPAHREMLDGLSP